MTDEAPISAPGIAAAQFTMTNEEAAGLRRRFAEVARGHAHLAGLPPRPPFTPEEIREFLTACCTTVSAGETLVVRLSEDWAPNQVREYQDTMNAGTEYLGWPFRVLVVLGEELGVVKAGSEDGGA